MAGEMAGRSPGADVIACLELMQQDQAKSAAILNDAHAMTDVTGFGLLGHLRGICDASDVGAVLRYAEIPMMQGAQALSAAGVRSSLFPDNLAGAGEVEGPAPDLLFDPQTAGGLLATVRAGAANARLDKLRAAGYTAAIIGEITADKAIKVG
jgi:selenide,water dikinase